MSSSSRCPRAGPRFDPAGDTRDLLQLPSRPGPAIGDEAGRGGRRYHDDDEVCGDLDIPVVFPEQDVQETLAEVLAEHNVHQLHVAETEKYAHVTYFFNGGREREWSGEKRLLVPIAP